MVTEAVASSTWHRAAPLRAAGLPLLVAGVGLEAEALALLLPGATEGSPWLGFMALHGAAALLLAFSMLARLPRRDAVPAWAVFALLLSLALFVPLLGALLLWTAATLAQRYPARARNARIALLRAPEHAQPTGPREGNYGHGAIRPLLGNPSAPAGRRLKALLALEHVPASRASELLRTVLNDQDEDIRLIAHGILDKREKGVQEAIDEAQVQLSQAQGPARLPALRRLAQLQWELIYGELAVGDVRIHLLASIRALVEEALQLAPNEPGLWYMQGRLALERGDGGEAECCMEQALRCGLPRGRALPWLAEIAFRDRRYQRVRACLGELSGAPLESAVSTSVRYWCGGQA